MVEVGLGKRVGMVNPPRVVRGALEVDPESSLAFLSVVVRSRRLCASAWTAMPKMTKARMRVVFMLNED